MFVGDFFERGQRQHNCRKLTSFIISIFSCSNGEVSQENQHNHGPAADLKMFEKSRKDRTSANLELSQEAKELLESLDENVRPVETAQHLPHVVNGLATLWNKPLAMDNYFIELMIDHRGTRKGFPPRVAAEIAGLQEYYSTIVYPKTSHNVWDKGDQ